MPRCGGMTLLRFIRPDLAIPVGGGHFGLDTMESGGQFHHRHGIPAPGGEPAEQQAGEHNAECVTH
jgi:hypothetical protein